MARHGFVLDLKDRAEPPASTDDDDSDTSSSQIPTPTADDVGQAVIGALGSSQFFPTSMEQVLAPFLFKTL